MIIMISLKKGENMQIGGKKWKNKKEKKKVIAHVYTYNTTQHEFKQQPLYRGLEKRARSILTGAAFAVLPPCED